MDSVKKIPISDKKLRQFPKEYLSVLYHKKYKNIKEISNILKIGYGTTYRLFLKHNIKTRNNSNKQIGKLNHNYIDGRTNIIHLCRNCNKPVRNIYAKLCQKCYCKTLSGEMHPNWRGGSSFENYPKVWTKRFKNNIRKRDNYICRNCGKSQQLNKKISGHDLNIHHIDYNKENCSISNLITLCNSCHMKTHYNRNYWIDYFKKLILKYGGVPSIRES